MLKRFASPHPPDANGWTRERDEGCGADPIESLESAGSRMRAASAQALKGRGTAWAMPHRFESSEIVDCDDGWGSLEQQVLEEPGRPETVCVEGAARSIIARNDSPDISFDLSVNPYRGCEHGCIYCFARPTHSYLNLSPGLDFETRIFAKSNAAELLRQSFTKPSYVPQVINIGSATDAYQPVERKLGLTRAVIEVMSEFQHPFSVITKSSGIERDIDLIAPMARRGLAVAYVSVTTLDPGLARIMEPRAASPQRRMETLRRLSDAGIPTGISVSPLIPFINEPELERILEAGAAAGAERGFSVILRLPWEVSPLFQQWLEAHFPDRAARVMARVRDMRGGKAYDASFGTRLRGQGVWADLLRQRLDKARARLGLDRERHVLDTSLFRRPSQTRPQGDLFGHPPV